MSKSDAEEKYKAKVNETFIYDKFPVPEHVQELNIVLVTIFNRTF
jgi:hypothetical protein